MQLSSIIAHIALATVITALTTLPTDAASSLMTESIHTNNVKVNGDTGAMRNLGGGRRLRVAQMLDPSVVDAYGTQTKTNDMTPPSSYTTPTFQTEPETVEPPCPPSSETQPPPSPPALDTELPMKPPVGASPSPPTYPETVQPETVEPPCPPSSETQPPPSPPALDTQSPLHPDVKNSMTPEPLTAAPLSPPPLEFVYT